MAAQYSFDRSRLIYELVVRQEPKQARMCGVGGKADRRPIDPPPIVQLRVIHPSVPGNSVAGSSKTRRDNSAGSDSASPDPSSFADGVADDSTYSQSYLQNPYYFMFACLARPDDETELHWLKDGRTRCTTGSVVSSLYHLKDPQNNNEDAGFFVFPDLSVRTEGSYRLKLSLFEVVGNNVHHCKSIYSAPFYVYTAKKFPGMEESTPLSCSLADQGIKIRIRKDIRVRKRQIPALSQPLSTDVDGLDSDGDEEDDPDRRPKRQKRSRNDTFADAGGSGLSGVGAVQQQLSWSPAASINPSLGANIQPSTAPPNSMPSSSPSVIPAPPKPGKDLQPANGMVMSVHLPPGGSLPGPSVFDGRGGGIIQMDPPSQPALLNQQKSPQIDNSSTQYRDSSQVDGAASLSPQLSPSSQQSHPQYPAPPSPVEATQPPPQQQALQPQHQPSHTLQNANGPPQQVAPHPSNHGPPPAMQHQPQHPQHMQHPQAGYVSSPYPQWGPTAPMSAPAQPAVYDPYYHHQQHTHYATYAPPQQPLPPPPARYDYGTGMYTHSPAPPPPPPAMPGYGYYDQHQQHHQPPHSHPQQQMVPQHPHPYPQHQVHAPPPMPQYAPPPPAPASTNTPSAGGTPTSMVADSTQIGNGTNGSTPTQPPPNFASGSGVAAASAQTPVTQYDYGVVYNNRPPESATGRGYGAPTPPQAPSQYNMTPMHPAPMPAPAPPHHAAHPQAYAMHSAGGPPPHHPTPMRHSSYGPPPPHPHAPHPHPAYSYATYAAPPPPAPEWGGQGFVTNHQHGWDTYAHHPQHPQQQGHLPVGQPQSHTPGGAPSGTMVNPGGVDQGHRIQLAPIPNENNPNNNGNGANNVSPHSPVRSSNSSPPSMRTNGRVTMSNSVGERVDDGVHGYRNQGQVQGKKNPLSIGSIISNDAR